jgi:hypothetical protein
VHRCLALNSQVRQKRADESIHNQLLCPILVRVHLEDHSTILFRRFLCGPSLSSGQVEELMLHASEQTLLSTLAWSLVTQFRGGNHAGIHHFGELRCESPFPLMKCWLVLNCAVEQRLARQAHNLEVVGSIPTGATDSQPFPHPFHGRIASQRW